ncbi:MAG: 16S rRNA (cytosine(1402)-N(4))-methyltransferase RsmH [Actinomycetota bacterium]|nr:16S rRNA (cytosine(1402)-N(4))-methyltransferase RsmH [Actinomycetota bacterium]
MGHEQSVPSGHPHHEPVMAQRVVELLAVPQASPARPAVLADATIGAAGHAAAVLAASGAGLHLVGFDRDPEALALARRRLAAYGPRMTLVHATYDRFTEHVGPIVERVGPLLGVLYDLGVSSLQLDRPERGFSFRADAPLDMRMDPTKGPTAAEIVNSADAGELALLLKTYGEERYARRIASAIVRARPVTTTGGLAEIVAAVVPRSTARRGRPTARQATVHPATRTFQALRIAVNAELDLFSASLPQALELAAPAETSGPCPDQEQAGRGGRIAVLSYHSLEDRIAKRSFSDAAAGCICPPDLPVCGCGRVPLVRHLTRGAERPDDAEVARNPRARSARLRAVEKIAQPGREAGERGANEAPRGDRMRPQES